MELGDADRAPQTSVASPAVRHGARRHLLLNQSSWCLLFAALLQRRPKRGDYPTAGVTGAGAKVISHRRRSDLRALKGEVGCA
jgi:hypothetical protein